METFKRLVNELLIRLTDNLPKIAFSRIAARWNEIVALRLHTETQTAVFKEIQFKNSSQIEFYYNTIMKVQKTSNLMKTREMHQLTFTRESALISPVLPHEINYLRVDNNYSEATCQTSRSGHELQEYIDLDETLDNMSHEVCFDPVVEPIVSTGHEHEAYICHHELPQYEELQPLNNAAEPAISIGLEDIVLKQETCPACKNVGVQWIIRNSEKKFISIDGHKRGFKYCPKLQRDVLPQERVSMRKDRNRQNLSFKRQRITHLD